MKGWGAYIIIALGVLGYKAMTDADRDDSGAIVDGGTVDAFDIRVGDCFDDSDGWGDEISSLPGVPCSEPHDNEVFAVFDLNVNTFPEGNALGEMVFDACLDRFQGFVGRDYESSSLDIMTLYPSRESWSQRNDREVVCAVYDMEAKKLTGSVGGLGL